MTVHIATKVVNWTSRYARLLMKQEADLAGLFETRCLQEGRKAKL